MTVYHGISNSGNMREVQKVSALFALQFYFIDDYENKIHNFSP
jgi:hypothetical protein